MTASNTTLTSLWIDDGSGGLTAAGSPLKVMQQGTPIKMATTSGTAIKDDVLKFYKEQGLDSVAKDAGILDANGELMTSYTQPQTQQQQQQHVIPRNTVQMIAVPISASPAKSPGQASIYPRMASVPSSIGGSPVIISTPQRNMMATQQYIATPISMESPQQWSTGKKRTTEYIDLEFSDSKRRKGEKGGKGLRHFSMKVCEKVQKKGITSYNEVADELVTEFTDPRNMTMTDQYDQKNIRRRVYDALNVLMAMNIISKEKKEIKWIGLPTNSAQECHDLEREKQKRVDRIKQKTQQLQELILQQIAFKNLVQRNRQQEQTRGPPTSNSAIQLPFIIVNTSKKTVIDCSISNDKYEYLFNFDNTFEIHDDIEVLKRMGMAYGLQNGACQSEELRKAVKMVPKALEPYVIEMAQGKTGGSLGAIVPSTSIKQEPGTSGMSTPATKYNPYAVQSPLATPLSLDQHADAEVATAMGHHVLSRQSSYSNLTSARDSPEDGYSDESDSNRSSPADFI